jgi:Zn-finger nucleic acid-binding protein
MGSYLKDALTQTRRTSVPVFHAQNLLSMPISKVACPRDQKPMRIIVHQGVVLDICPTCFSIWFDAGEYEKISGIGKSRSNRGDNFLEINIIPQSQQEVSLNCISSDGDTLNCVIEFVGEAVGNIFDGL